MTHRIPCAVLAAVLLFFLCACSEGSSPERLQPEDEAVIDTAVPTKPAEKDKNNVTHHSNSLTDPVNTDNNNRPFDLDGSVDHLSTQEQVFRDFLNAYYGGTSDLIIEPQGTSGDTYRNAAGEFDWFSLISVTDKKGEQLLFAMMVSDPQFPEVYLVHGSELESVWSVAPEEYYDSDTNTEICKDVSEREQLEALLALLAPITDYTLYGHVNNFFSIAITAVMAPSQENVLSELQNVQLSILNTTEAIMETVPPQGYGLQEQWSELADECISLNKHINSAIAAAADHDQYTVLEKREICGNMDLVEKAVGIQNILSKELATCEEAEQKAAIEVKVSYAECEAKALRYARYYFNRQDISELDGSSTPATFEDISGKHYVFTVAGENDVWILVSVEDCSVVCRERIDGGFRYIYVDDSQLPAAEGDTAMPDVMGMKFEDAVALITSMGLEYEPGAMDLDTVAEGCVCHCYPAPGNLLTSDTVVHLTKEIDVNT